jgi:hypothetical protein
MFINFIIILLVIFIVLFATKTIKLKKLFKQNNKNNNLISCNQIEKELNKNFENKHFKCKNNKYNIFTFKQKNEFQFDLYLKDCYINDNIIFDGFNRKLYSKNEMFDNTFIIKNEDENKYNDLCYLIYNNINIPVSLRFFENREIMIKLNNNIRINSILNSNKPILSIIYDISEIDELSYRIELQKDEIYKENIKKKIIDAEKKKELKKEVTNELIDEGILISKNSNKFNLY